MHAFLKIAAIGVVVLAAGGFWFTQRDEIDPLMTPERLARIQASPHYKNGEFQPDVPHEPVNADMSFWKSFLFPKAGFNIPAEPMKSEKTDLKALPRDEDVVVWMGHSSFYMQLDGKKILIDPVAAQYAAPVPFIDKAFEGSNVYGPEDIPDDIDVMVLSHDHWDHLDYDFVKKIEPKVKQVVTGLGNGGYYEKWGYPLAKIHETDWNEEVKLDDGLSVWVLPTRHFSGRLLKRNQTLPASFAFITANRKVYYSGDGGYDGRFQQIGQAFGGFDLAIMEDGQYNQNWHSVHMMPEESAQAAEEIGARAVIPCHNGKYALSMHSWQEPYERLEQASQGKNYRLLTPKIGELVRIGDASQTFTKWWKAME
ncbi:MAG: MBL fold metallo-hydrolase [Megasphaera sp.]|uniref:MBL fold metallo-hydrolase n=1 Tax=Megasphaera sp. TaxID=2023260 RepID=UPI0025C5EFDC|nr:MBL fold metallo-hydrolase [Megasphaera sp.]MCI7599774.1 MBL fold metallo-hydrolase [Megasphaera sp.]